MSADLLAVTESGLYCTAGDFHIDPWRPVPRAVITHAHADHARPGSDRYLCAAPGMPVLRTRLGEEAAIESLPYGETTTLGAARVSLHPAGHVLGSAQVRVEVAGQVWVVSGDYKLAADPTCDPFEPIRCHTFVTESTFGLPIYRWPDPQEELARLLAWWRGAAAEGRASLLFTYALGKAQRILALLGAAGHLPGPIYCHGAVERLNEAYRRAGVRLPVAQYAGVGDGARGREGWAGSLIVAPTSAQGTPWLRKFGATATAFASGWMLVRGMRRRRSVDRGFVLSDHADWPGLQHAIAATGAERVLVTHGAVNPLVRWLREQGLQAAALATPYEGEQEDAADGEEPREEQTGGGTE